MKFVVEWRIKPAYVTPFTLATDRNWTKFESYPTESLAEASVTVNNKAAGLAGRNPSSSAGRHVMEYRLRPSKPCSRNRKSGS